MKRPENPLPSTEESSESTTAKRLRQDQAQAFAEDIAEIQVSLSERQSQKLEVDDEHLHPFLESRPDNRPNQVMERNHQMIPPHIIEDEVPQSRHNSAGPNFHPSYDSDKDEMDDQLWMSAPQGKRVPRVGDSFQVGKLPYPSE